MARSRRIDNPVSLFPFLAVLMCTMGALIFLLIVVTTSIKEEAIAVAKRPVIEKDAVPKPRVLQSGSFDMPMADLGEAAPFPVIASSVDPSATPPRIPTGPTFESIQAELVSLIGVRTELENQLDRQRLARQQLQGEIARLSDAVNLAQQRAAEVEAEFQATLSRVQSKQLELANATDDRKRLVKLINESQEMVSLQELANSKATSEFVIVPYDGLTGTTRRPIILDCTDQAIRLVGEDIELTPAQLVGYTPLTNPLKSGVRELIRYWATSNSVQENPAKEPVPYVLLIVRPSGTVAFYVARKYLQDLGADFGYELVEEDFKFSSQKSPDRAVELCRGAIVQTLREKQASGGRQVATFLEGLEADNRRQRISAAAKSALPGRNDTGSGKSPGNASNREGGGGGGGGSFDDFAEPGNSFNRLDSRELGKRGGRASQNFFNSNGFQNRPGEASPDSAQAEGTQSQPGTGQPLLAGSANNGGGDRSLVGAGRLPQPIPPDRDSTQNIDQPELDSPFRTDRAIGSKVGGPQGDPSSNGSNQDGSESPDASLNQERSDGSKPGPFGNQQSDDRLVGGSSTRDVSPFEQPSNSGSASDRPGQSAMTAPSAAGQQRSRAVPQPTLDLKPDSNRNAHQFKRQWGKQNPNGSIALEKTMTIRLSDQRVVIGDKLQIRITEDRLPEQIVEWTVEAIDRVAQDWGQPPSRFYWSPAVNLVVEPGGDLMLERMTRTLRKYGVSVEVEGS